MSNELPPSPDIAWSKLIHDDSGDGPGVVRLPLIADRCDLLERSGRVDPLPFVDDEVRKRWVLAPIDLAVATLSTCEPLPYGATTDASTPSWWLGS